MSEIIYLARDDVFESAVPSVFLFEVDNYEQERKKCTISCSTKKKSMLTENARSLRKRKINDKISMQESERM